MEYLKINYTLSKLESETELKIFASDNVAGLEKLPIYGWDTIRIIQTVIQKLYLYLSGSPPKLGEPHFPISIYVGVITVLTGRIGGIFNSQIGSPFFTSNSPWGKSPEGGHV